MIYFSRITLFHIGQAAEDDLPDETPNPVPGGLDHKISLRDGYTRHGEILRPGLLSRSISPCNPAEYQPLANITGPLVEISPDRPELPCDV